jgi:predicted permease
MARFREFFARLRGTFGARDLDSRLSEEIDFHLDMHADRARRRGVSADKARRDAVVAFGGCDGWREAARDEVRERTVEGTWQDARYALRTLRKSPAFTIIALLTVALGIGATTAVYSVVSGVLIRPLPFGTPDRLAAIWPTKTISNAELEYLQEHSRAFAAVAAFSPGWGIPLTGSGEPRQLDAARVSTNFFEVLGARPIIGRGFIDGESAPDRWNVAVLSHSLWMRQFGGDRSVVGRVVDLDGAPHRIVGVMPTQFEAFQAGVDAWLPLQIDRASRFYTGQTAIAFGRLAPASTFASANAELSTFVPQMRTAFSYTDDYSKGSTVTSLQDSLVGGVRGSLLVLLGAVAAVLLIAGANVGNLLLVHAIGRRRELAVRRALGASRGQIARQLVVQSVVVSLIGGTIGIALGVAGVRALKAILPASLPFLKSVSLDWRVLAASAAVTIVVGLVFGIAPALFATRVDPDGALRVSAQSGGGRAGEATRRALVVAEIALAMVLVVGAGLMTTTLWRLNRVDLGFDPSGVLSLRVQPPSSRVTSIDEVRVYFDDMMRRIAAQPGALAVGASQHLPLTGFNWSGSLDIEKAPLPANATHPRVIWRSVAGDYFAAMKVPLKRGRLFLATDTRATLPVIIINEAMARRYWSGADPIGERIKIGNGSKNDWATIVGVVGSVRFSSPTTEPGDEVYRPNAQQGQTSMHLVVRTTGDPMRVVESVRAAIRSMDTNVPIAEVRSLGEVFAASTATPRTIAMLLVGFASVGLVLGAIGIFGVVSYAVTQRTRELGIRSALGAVEGRIVTMIVGESARLALTGIVIGGIAAVFAARSLRTLLFGVTTSDPRVYVAVALTMALVAVAAAYLPARRAARVDPLIALRGD